MDEYREYWGLEDDVEDDCKQQVFYRCDDCGRELIEGFTGYYVQTDPIGFTDEDTERRLVCRSCFRRYYGQGFLKTIVKL